MDTTSVIKLDDAAFVDSIMCSQKVVVVRTVIDTQNNSNHMPSADARKRHLSANSDDELPTKRRPSAEKNRDNQYLFELMTAAKFEKRKTVSHFNVYIF